MNKREWMLHTTSAAFANAKTVDLDALGKAYDAICAATPETAQEGAWVEHDGDVSKAPPEGEAIEVQFRNGTTCGTNSNNVAWDHVDSARDVMRWRYA